MASREAGKRVTDDEEPVPDGSRRKLEIAACKGLPREIIDSGVQKHVFERMDFLWRASHSLRVSSPSMSRMYSLSVEYQVLFKAHPFEYRCPRDQLRKLFVEQGPSGAKSLSEWVSESICKDCGSVLTPGINCRVRLKHRSLASPRNKKATKSKGSKKYRNEVVTTCLLCDRVSVQGGTERRAHHSRQRKRKTRKSTTPKLTGSGGDASNKHAKAADHTPTASSSRSRGLRQPATEPTKKQLSRYLSDDSGSLEERLLSVRGSSSRKKGRTESGYLAMDSSKSDRGSASIDHGAVGNQESGGAGAGTKKSSKPGGSEPLSLLERIRKEAKKKRRKENASSTGKPTVPAHNNSNSCG